MLLQCNIDSRKECSFTLRNDFVTYPHPTCLDDRPDKVQKPVNLIYSVEHTLQLALRRDNLHINQ
jgi:hypothetical protein